MTAAKTERRRNEERGDRLPRCSLTLQTREGLNNKGDKETFFVADVVLQNEGIWVAGANLLAKKTDQDMEKRTAKSKDSDSERIFLYDTVLQYEGLCVTSMRPPLMICG